ncbi:hypothetical protein [Sporosarcina sp. NPDC096371]|uniref:hypothetical protein n=1 Tax=Sporosarcina sp. NPDC096371 TaxID=3364530 RepID=UPI0038286054
MNGGNKTKKALAMDSLRLQEALDKIERLRQNPETVRMAISREIHLMDELQRLEDAELKGRAESEKEIILNMHAANLPTESIAQFTQVPLEKVQEIIKSAER